MKEIMMKLASNAALWIMFVLLYGLYYMVINRIGWNGPIPNSEFIKFMSLETWAIQIASAVLLFAFFALITHRSRGKREIEQGKKLMDIALIEWSSILFNFGSLAIAVAIFTGQYKILLTLPLTYGLGILIHPRPSKVTTGTKKTTWTGTKTAGTGNAKEDVNIVWPREHQRPPLPRSKRLYRRRGRTVTI